jgi:hypothetical protein
MSKFLRFILAPLAAAAIVSLATPVFAAGGPTSCRLQAGPSTVSIAVTGEKPSATSYTLNIDVPNYPGPTSVTTPRHASGSWYYVELVNGVNGVYSAQLVANKASGPSRVVATCSATIAS